MEIKLKIEAQGLEDAISKLAEALTNLEANQKPAVSVVETEQVNEDTSSDAEVEAEVPEDKEEPKEKASHGIKLETVRAKMVELARAGKQPEMEKIIKSFGVDKLSSIPEEHYPEVIEKVEALL